MLSNMLNIAPVQWAAAILGALLVGFSKSGIAGLGILFVALFATAFPSTKQASGIVLPMLILGDWIAVVAYRRHLQWGHLGRLFPWTAAGVVLGFFALGHLSDRRAKTLIGAIILTMAVMSYWQRFRHRRLASHAVAPDAAGAVAQSIHWAFAAAIGVIAGFTTLVANAAGPLMAIYLIAMRLPKMEYVGTAAVFFAVLNLFKLPFMVRLGLVTPQSLELNLALAPCVLIGAFAGRRLLFRINQRLFEELALGLSAAAGLVLLF